MTSPLLPAAAAGAVTGAGAWLVARGLKPPPPRLVDALAALHRQPGDPPRPARLVARAGQPAVPLLTDLGLPTAGICGDLLVLDRNPDDHLAEKAALAATGLALPLAMTVLLTLAGLPVGWVLPAWIAVLLAAVGFVVPDVGVRAEANQRRADFRYALSCFLDLVVIDLAGGAGVEAALTDAATVGHGWAYTQLRDAITEAQITRRSPWETLADLGGRLRVPEVQELAATVALAGSEGAKVKASLAAKAQALRVHQLAHAEAEAQAATERMSIPVVLLFAGFLLLIAFPAVVHILTGL